MNKKRSKISQAFEESRVGLLLAVLFIVFKLFFGRTPFVLSEAVFTIIFIVVFFFLKGYFWGASSVKFHEQMSQKKEELYEKLEGLRCYKCFHVINPEEDKCPNCGWTWKT